MERKLEGKVALVTGAGRGLGRSYAIRLARLGADVVVNDISLTSHEEYDEKLSAADVPAECRSHGVRSTGLVADVVDRDSVRDMIERIEGEYGRLDILVNNAGGALFGNDWQKTIDLNLYGTVNSCEAAAPLMKKQRDGRIINCGSQAGLQGRGGGAYSVSKAGVIHYTRVLAHELGPYGINVNCIAPGFILSSRALAGGRGDADQKRILEPQIALRRLGEPEECAKVVEFLATDLADYVTGQVIPVCGGFVLS